MKTRRTAKRRKLASRVKRAMNLYKSNKLLNTTPKITKSKSTMEQKTIWWHKFMTKECLLIAFVGFLLGAWTAAYHLHPGLPFPEPPDDVDGECHDVMFTASDSHGAMECPSTRQHLRVVLAGTAAVCECKH